ncbi:PREDICTED: salicylate/benzoate carboxyl methyltransferase-like isoform X1 [Camelina sativa]|uniref:Salicylate/benzoate carboxyl methyltransferase-like isoform X1 n=1 Tax=Camelina sativa TaxID=90675 RepID=A0ABM0TB67_CAMSA|nr:PREDICTED: salicylate/benzoate carboxyl methyltransferase-like isoform X1 [Camelina sativa]
MREVASLNTIHYFDNSWLRDMDSRFIHSTSFLRCNDKSENENERNNGDVIIQNSFASPLCMSGGDGDNSYSTNSLLQRRVLSKAKPVLIKNTKELMINLNFPRYIKVADLGCSSGQNTFLAMSEIINTINVLCQERNQDPPEIDCCLNDLPNNDFNTTFKFIQFFNEKNTTSKELYFVSGVPGSFYSRLFPRRSLHFVHSSYGLHWLSKVLEGLEENKMSVYIKNSSPLSTYKAYLNQFQRDFMTFLKLRAEEMVSNGCMVLTFIGRSTIDNPLHRDCCHFWTLLSKALSDLVVEGLVSASKVNSFYIPFYDPNEKEVKEMVEKEGSFEIKDLETHGYDLGHCNQDETKRSKSGKNEANYIRAVSEPLLVAHFGDAIINILFNKFAHHVSQHASCKNKTTVSIVVSLTRKKTFLMS